MRHPVKALRYMSRFQCIGSDCEDHCCSGWQIPLDQNDCDVMSDAMNDNPVLMEKYHQSVAQKESPTGSNKIATLTFGENGGCRFLDGGLCIIHRDYGETALSKACATYPRALSDFGDHFELSGSLSCPEVARLCLLAEDAMVWDNYDWSRLPPRIELKEIAEKLNTDNYYAAYFHRIREVIEWVMDFRGYPIEEKIYLILYFAKRISSFYHKGCTSDPGPRLDRTTAMLSKVTYLEKVLSNFKTVQRPADLGARFIQLSLTCRLKHKNRVRYNRLCMEILSGYVNVPAQDLMKQGGEIPLLPADVWAVYEQRKTAVFKQHGLRITLYFRNFCNNYWFSHSLSEAHDLSFHINRLILHLAVIRFLFFSHPDLRISKPEDRIDIAELDRVIVEVVQIYMKNMSHNAAMIDHIHQAMKAQGFDKLSDMASLLWV